jgi:penicillin amidase
VRLAGLTAPAEALRDRWGAPHIYAASEADAFFVQGFVHAQDRLWQMEFQRRLVAGRLSEVFGKDTVAVDRWMRTLGMRRVAEIEAGRLTGEARDMLAAYAAGVNACIGQGRLPIEFRLLRYRPEPWTPADSLAWAKMMAWSLSVNWEAELLRAALACRIGPDAAAELEPPYPVYQPLIAPVGSELARASLAALSRAEAARPFTCPPPEAGLGSNNWVLAGSRTATGRPLLANDMHLLMAIPAVWYENHLEGGGLAVTGVTFPGVPGVVAGHNRHVAWGFTNGFPDVQDLYIERVRRLPNGRPQYEFRGEWRDVEVRRETILVKGGQPVVEEVLLTHHGPIINALAADLIAEGGCALRSVDAPEPPLALRWTALEPDTMFQALLEMGRARNCLEFRAALRHWATPVQNTVYADVDGNIGYSFPGRVPIRAHGDGRLPAPGWTGDYEWTGYVPFDELPHLYNPPQGYVATANNRVTSDDYPYWLGRDYCMGDRAERIVELIQAQPVIDSAYIRRMQFDLLSPTARAIGRQIAGLASDHAEIQADIEKLRSVLDLFTAWDGRLAVDSAAAAVYQAFMRQMLDLVLTNKISTLTGRYMGRGPTPVLAETSIFGHRSWEWLRELLTRQESDWYNLAPREAVLSGYTAWNERDDVMAAALRRARQFLTERLGADPAGWSWGKLHRLRYAHLLGRVPALAGFFDRGPYPLGGDSTTVWATGATFHTLDSDQVVGPPFRFIADVGDWDKCLGLLAPGQSGHPASPHYDDQIAAWFEGGYHPMLWSRPAVEGAAVARLRLVP